MTMDLDTKKQALVVLIEHSLLLSSEVKMLLLATAPAMEEAEVVELGRLLALEREAVLEDVPAFETSIDSVLRALEERIKQSPAQIESEKVYVGVGKP